MNKEYKHNLESNWAIKPLVYGALTGLIGGSLVYFLMDSFPKDVEPSTSLGGGILFGAMTFMFSSVFYTGFLKKNPRKSKKNIENILN